MERSITVSDWMQAYAEKYDDREELIEACMQATGRCRDTVVRAVRKSGKWGEDRVVKGKSKSKASDLSLPKFRTIPESEVRSRHDDIYKIRLGARSLKRGEYTTDNEFKDGCKISTRGRALTRQSEFEPFHGKAPGGEIYWGHQESIAQLKADHVLS